MFVDKNNNFVFVIEINITAVILKSYRFSEAKTNPMCYSVRSYMFVESNSPLEDRTPLGVQY